MTRYTVPFIAFLLILLAGWKSDTTTRFVFTKASTLWVTGTSSLHDWRCDAAQVEGWVDAQMDQTITDISKAEISVQAGKLECKNGTMNKKTSTALQADTHKNIRYELTTAEVLPGTDQVFRVKTTGKLTIAGKTRTVTMTVQGKMNANGQVRLTGELPVTMSEYGIDPPTAMLGTLKTGDKVTVHFEVVAASSQDL